MPSTNNSGPHRGRRRWPRRAPTPRSEPRAENPSTPSTQQAWPDNGDTTPSNQAGPSNQASISNQVFPIAWLGELEKDELKQQRARARRNRIAHRRPRGPFLSMPPIDVVVSRWQCEVYFELPGASRENIDLSWSSDDNKFTVSVHPDGPYVYWSDRHVVRERSNLFERTILLEDILLGTAMEEAIVKAHEVGVRTLMRNGLLVICIVNMSPAVLAVRDWEATIRSRHLDLDMPEIPLDWTVDGVKYEASTRIVLERSVPWSTRTRD
ncbi:hypothetical protein CIB48_g8824 [Xylaria polymorpha]|nr:hypothetical protein CIB48_g8824 [Xylaria polymorpha]